MKDHIKCQVSITVRKHINRFLGVESGMGVKRRGRYISLTMIMLKYVHTCVEPIKLHALNMYNSCQLCLNKAIKFRK